MFLDPNREGIEVWYDNKLRILVGHPRVCANYIIDLCSYDVDEFNDNVLNTKMLFYIGNKKYEQLTIPVLDINGMGQTYEDIFNEIKFKYEKLDAKRIKF